MVELRSTSPKPAIDVLLGIGLLGLAVAVLSAWPQNLGVSDESLFLYHAKRVYLGEVPYRDFFEFYTPLAFYLMALCYAVGGVDLATAKLATALVHGTTVLLVYACGRTVRAPRALCVAGALLFLALGQPAWHYASPHWIATALLVLILLLLLRRQSLRATGRDQALWPIGVATGLLAAMQQQTGLPIAIGIAALLGVEVVLDRRFGRTPGRRPLVAGMAELGASILVVLVPILGIHVVLAGFMTVFEQIVVFPLTGYREVNRVSWGNVHRMTRDLAPYSLPTLLAVLPPVLVASGVMRVVHHVRRAEREAIERASSLTIYAVATACTIVNRPDFVHLAFVMPVYLVVAIETVDYVARRLDPPGRCRSVVVVTGSLVLLVASGYRLQSNLERAQRDYSVPMETAFGHVDFTSEIEAELYRRVRASVDEAEKRMLFCYPVQASLYLTVPADNPTPFSLMLPGLNSPEQYEEAIAALESSGVERILLMPFFDSPRDPIYAWVDERFECDGGRRPCWLYVRPN